MNNHETVSYTHLIKYWKILQKTKWNYNQKIMPKYSIVEIVLETNIDFENQESMTHHIIDCSVSLASQIQEYLIQSQDVYKRQVFHLVYDRKSYQDQE